MTSNFKNVEDDVFRSIFNSLQRVVNRTSHEHGFYDRMIEDGTKLALIHSEVSEALEALRLGNPQSEKLPEFTAAEEELADVIIRIMDFAEFKQYRLVDALFAKIGYNLGREYMHGKLF